MARRGQKTTLEERIEIGERSKAGQRDPEIAVAMGRPVWTMRKWRRKYQRDGRSGLVSCVVWREGIDIECPGCVRQNREGASFSPECAGLL